MGVCLQGGLHPEGEGLHPGGMPTGGFASGGRGSASGERGVCIGGDRSPTGTRKADSMHPAGMLPCYLLKRFF